MSGYLADCFDDAGCAWARQRGAGVVLGEFVPDKVALVDMGTLVRQLNAMKAPTRLQARILLADAQQMLLQAIGWAIVDNLPGPTRRAEVKALVDAAVAANASGAPTDPCPNVAALKVACVRAVAEADAVAEYHAKYSEAMSHWYNRLFAAAIDVTQATVELAKNVGKAVEDTVKKGVDTVKGALPWVLGAGALVLLGPALLGVISRGRRRVE